MRIHVLGLFIFIFSFQTSFIPFAQSQMLRNTYTACVTLQTLTHRHSLRAELSLLLDNVISVGISEVKLSPTHSRYVNVSLSISVMFTVPCVYTQRDFQLKKHIALGLTSHESWSGGHRRLFLLISTYFFLFPFFWSLTLGYRLWKAVGVLCQKARSL